jgi:hypothetical protein
VSAACTIHVYGDGSCAYLGQSYALVAELLAVLNAEVEGPPLQLAFEAPTDYEAVGKIIYGLHRVGAGARLVSPAAVEVPGTGAARCLSPF